MYKKKYVRDIKELDFQRLKALYDKAMEDYKVTQSISNKPSDKDNTGKKKWGRLTGPAYARSLWDFVNCIESEGWGDAGYDLEISNRALSDFEIIRRSDIETTRQLLYYFARSEHWMTGGYADFIEKGFLAAVIARLEKLFEKDADSAGTANCT